MKKSALIIGTVMLPATVAMAASGDNGLSSGSDMNTNRAPAPTANDNAPSDMNRGNTQSSGDFASDTRPESGAQKFKRTTEQFLMSDENTDGPGYTYAQGEYVPQGTAHNLHEHGSKHNSLHGYGGDVSLGFPTGSDLPVHPILQGGWHRLNLHNGDLGLNESYVGLGGETFYDLSDMTGMKDTGIGFYGTVNYERLMARHVTAQGEHNAGPTADGWGISTGLRWMALPQFEVNPHAKYRDFGTLSGDGVDLGSPHGFDYGMRLVGYLDEGHHLGLTADYTRSDMGIGRGSDEVKIHNKVSVGARFTF